MEILCKGKSLGLEEVGLLLCVFASFAINYKTAKCTKRHNVFQCSKIILPNFSGL